MSVETTYAPEAFAGGQDENVFTFQSMIGEPTYIKVKKTLTSSGAETDLTYTTDYSVSLESDGIGGTVTFVASFSTLYTTTVYRVTSNTQESDYDDYNQMPAETLEADFDRRCFISQEDAEETNRSLTIPITVSGFDTEIPVPVASKYLKINAAVDAFELDSLTVTTTAYDGTFGAGTDAAKPASPEANDLYYATDTNVLYRCATAGTWTANTSLYLVTGGTGKIYDSAGTLIFDIDEDGNARFKGAVSDNVGSL